ncbi:Lin0368 family putative glycerol transporter subunit [Aminiphilus circumscriptus]|jgi:hypothetical protein|uniref:Lin0368 family putative glycerol transporter subunit n=1 Tax=Aminiphilus circumscriptus TaxID=290732 RepID=UPI00049275CA|nr:hypothetical protein [Aminiphilus circumscriptus]
MTGWTTANILSTLFGAALFPFMIAVAWGKMVEVFGAAGGWVAGFWIVGVSWLLNHGLGLHHQAGEVWIDMAFAAFVGLFVQSTLAGGKPGKAVPALISGVLGGLLGGLILSIMA